MAKISFTPTSPIPLEDFQWRQRYWRGLGLPVIGEAEATRIPLAIVGGGHSIEQFVDELAAFDGEIWAINHTVDWCHRHGIEATAFTIDPVYAGPETPFKKIVIGDTVRPDLYETLRGAEILLAKLGEEDILYHCAAASTSPMIASAAGYSHITFYGCEGNFKSNVTHAYGDQAKLNRMWITCGGQDFVTCPQFIMHVEFIAELVRALPNYMDVRGDGFLTSLIEHGDYDVTHVSRAIHDAIHKENPKHV